MRDPRIDITPGAVEIYARPSAAKGVWMACGYAAVSSAPQREIITTWAMSPTDGGFWAAGQHEIRERERDDARVSDHANLVTLPIWNRHQDTGRPVLNLAIRRIEGEPGVVLLSGLVEDDAGTFFRPEDEAHGVMMRGEVVGGFMRLSRIQADLEWTRGISLAQVQKTPVWRLGSEERWAARWTMSPDAARSAQRAVKLRCEIISGEAGPDAEKTFEEANRAAGLAVMRPGTDPTFDKVQRAMLSLGEPEPEAPLVTETEDRKRKDIMREAIRSVMDPEPDESPIP